MRILGEESLPRVSKFFAPTGGFACLPACSSCSFSASDGRSGPPQRAESDCLPPDLEGRKSNSKQVGIRQGRDREDFEVLPVFTLRGGLSQATRVFTGQLGDLVDQLNEAVAQ